MERFEDRITEPKFRIRSKMLLSFLALSLTSILIFGYFSFNALKRTGNYALESSASLGESAIKDSTIALEDLGAKIIRQKAEDFALECEVYLRAHPKMTVRDLQKSPEFLKIAVQSVGQTGYTLIYDRKGIMRFHPNPDLINYDLHNLRKKLPAFWNLFASTFNGKTGSGYYDWQDSDGVIRRKYMYMVPISDTHLMAAATTYIGEFTLPVRETQAKIAAATSDIRAHMNYQFEGAYTIYINLLIAMMLIVGTISLLLSRMITKPILVLAEGVKAIGRGNLGHRVEVKTGDELEELARSINRMSADLKVLHNNMADRERLLKELEIARSIQLGILPQHAPVIAGFELGACNIPATEIGGDFYDFIPLTKSCWGLVIADVSGKGMPAALFMALSRTLVRASALGNISAADAIRQANELICKDANPGMFVTVFYAILEPERKRLRYVNAGHNPPLLFRSDAPTPQELRAKGIALGVKTNADIRESYTELKENDVLVMYTDGVIETINERGEAYGKDRLAQCVRASLELPVADIMNRIRESVFSFAEPRAQFDDITMMVLKVKSV